MSFKTPLLSLWLIIPLMILLTLSGCENTESVPFNINLITKVKDPGMCLRQTSPKDQFIKHVYPKTYCKTSNDCPVTYMCDRSYNVCEPTAETKPFPNLYLKSLSINNSCFSSKDCPHFFEQCIHKPQHFKWSQKNCNNKNCPESFYCHQIFNVCIRN